MREEVKSSIGNTKSGLRKTNDLARKATKRVKENVFRINGEKISHPKENNVIRK